jgi:predicted Zn-dependent protease
MKTIRLFSKSTAIIAAAIATASLGQSAEAATLDLFGVGWVQPTITYVINAGHNVSSGAINAVVDAIEDWNTELDLIAGAPTFEVFVGPGKPDVTIQLKNGGGQVLGQTSVRTASRFSCVIESARVLLSGKAFGQGFSVVGIGNVARHELGHVVGLGHSDDPDDLMYAAAEAEDIFGDTPQPISDCDVNGVDAIYPLPEDCSVPSTWECP